MLGEFNRLYLSAAALSVLTLALAMPAKAEPVPRNGAAAGAVIARKVGEEVRFIDVSNWRIVDLKQDLLSGDVLRTNETGQLAILFSDRTQVRLGRNSSLVVKQITSGTDADTVLQLQSGTIWARAERGGTGVKIETAAAAAAIRGTDWTMTVNGAQTSLTVLEGLVNFSNPQGSVDVRQGEGAAATIGQAPRKIAIVDSDDREQMLYYLSPRNAFNFMPASPSPVAEMRRQADRILAVTPDERSTQDVLTLAEAQLSLDGRDKARETLRQLDGRRLSVADRARADLIRAILAAADKRYDEAAELFARAAPRLDVKRQNVAVYGRYYSRSLGNPNRVEPAPTVVESAYGALLKAYTAGFLKDIPAAIAIIRDAEGRFPNDATLPAYRAQLAILLNDRKQVEEALAKSLTLDPSEPTALEARANYRGDFKGDLTGALADLQAAAKVAPGSTTVWNALGNAYMERDDNQRAEEAFKKSIALDPEDPVAYANLANLYLSQDRVAEAKEAVDKALKADPGFDLALVVRGTYKLKTSQVDDAINDMLAGTVANPAYSDHAGDRALSEGRQDRRRAGARQRRPPRQQRFHDPRHSHGCRDR
jgi:tetratricopeptide (TPR) repeat protein